MIHLVLCLTIVQFSSAKLPEFSWDTLPVFFHSSNTSGLYSQQALKIIAKFSMVTIEKWQSFDVKNIDDEDDMVAVMKAVKEVNPNVATYFYMNSFKDRPEMTRMARQFDEHPDWALRDVNGSQVKNNQGYFVFDVSKLEVRKWWLNTCLNAIMAASGDGCFCDSSQRVTGQHFKPPVSDHKMKQWGEGLLNLTKEVQNALGSDKLLIGKVANQSYVKSVQIEFFRADNDSITELMLGASVGQVMQAHVPVFEDCHGDLINYMAAFLIGAGKYSYFGCGHWNATGDDIEPLIWHTEYDKPLGTPLGPATYSEGIWKREFAKGTKVEFNIKKNTGTIDWGSR